MSGGSQHNPNGRQSQLGSGWSPLQLQVASYLARAPQAHMASERGVTWHTPTPPHLYHVPAPSPPDPLQAALLQAMKGGAGGVFRRAAATPPDLYRHTPTPPDKHNMHRHTPSPGDPKGPLIPPEGLFPHLGPSRDKLRPEDILSFARGPPGATGPPGGLPGGVGPGGPGGGVDLSLGRGANGERAGGALSLSVRDAPTINSLIARAAPRHRVDSLLERLTPQPVPHSVIVPARAPPSPAPPSPSPSSNEDSVDSSSSSKRKRKPERVIRVPAVLDPPREPPPPPRPATPPKENGDAPPEANGPIKAKRKRSGSAETIDDIAAMIAEERVEPEPEPEPEPQPEPAGAGPAVTAHKLESVLASPEPEVERSEKKEAAAVAAAPRRRSTRVSNSELTNVPVESPSEAKPAEPEASGKSAEPTAASFVEVENELEKMFAGIEGEGTEQAGSVQEAPPVPDAGPVEGAGSMEVTPTAPKRRRKSQANKAEKKVNGEQKKKPGRKKAAAKLKEKPPLKDAYDSGSNASSGRSRGPYIQIRGPRDSPLSVSVVNACSGAGADEEPDGRRRGEFRNKGGGRARGLHCSTLGLRYDAATADASWRCAFCQRGPHAERLGDLFGPYQLQLDEEAWFHAECGVWAPGLLAAGARLWGLEEAVRLVRGERCGPCGGGGGGVCCGARGCAARAHLPCARRAAWRLDDTTLQARCPAHA